MYIFISILLLWRYTHKCERIKYILFNSLLTNNLKIFRQMYVSSSCAMDLGFTNTFFFFLLNILVWHWLIKLCRFQDSQFHSIPSHQVKSMSITIYPSPPYPLPLLPIPSSLWHAFLKRIFFKVLNYSSKWVYTWIHTHIYTLCVCVHV